MNLAEAMKTVIFRELPDDLREPLHSLQADLDWLFARVACDGSMAGPLKESVRNRLSQIESAAYRLANPPLPTVSEEKEG